MSTLSRERNGAIVALPKDVALSYSFEREALLTPQIRIPIVHSLHGGIYTRTAKIPAGWQVTGAIIDPETTMIANGDWLVLQDGDWVRFSGFHVIPAAGGRRQVVRAIADCIITLCFPSTATTVTEAEQQMSSEWELLQSQDGEPDVIINTHKDTKCQESQVPPS